jgi:hypothetical protein
MRGLQRRKCGENFEVPTVFPTLQQVPRTRGLPALGGPSKARGGGSSFASDSL